MALPSSRPDRKRLLLEEQRGGGGGMNERRVERGEDHPRLEWTECSFALVWLMCFELECSLFRYEKKEKGQRDSQEDRLFTLTFLRLFPGQSPLTIVSSGSTAFLYLAQDDRWSNWVEGADSKSAADVVHPGPGSFFSTNRNRNLCFRRSLVAFIRVLVPSSQLPSDSLRCLTCNS